MSKIVLARLWLHWCQCCAIFDEWRVKCYKQSASTVSASPILSFINDWLRYMSFIDLFEAKEWWSKRSLRHIGFQKDQDPFLVTDGPKIITHKISCEGLDPNS